MSSQERTNMNAQKYIQLLEEVKKVSNLKIVSYHFVVKFFNKFDLETFHQIHITMNNMSGLSNCQSDHCTLVVAIMKF